MGVERDYERRRKKQLAQNEKTDASALLPVRDSDGAWKRRQKSKKAKEPTPPSRADKEETTQSNADEPEMSVEQKKAAIAKLATQLLEAPHRHVALLRQLHEYACRDTVPAVRSPTP